MKNKTIIFDFDGTIGDTLAMGVKIYNEIAPRYRCKPVELADIPLLQTKRPRELMAEYGITHLTIPFLLFTIRKELGKQVSSIEPFTDMVEVLRILHESGATVGILTSNSKRNVEEFLKLNGIQHLFAFVYSGKHVFGKEKTMKQVIKREGIDINSVVYVGDETRDIVASKKAGIPIVSVTWGFNAKEILKTLEPDHLVDTPQELLDNLMK